MGFRKDAWATCWSVESKSDTLTTVRLSISRKNKETSEYEEDFSGFVSFYGTANAGKAASLKEKDRIKLGDVDVSAKYDKEKNKTFYTFKCFSFEKADGEKETAEVGEPSETPDIFNKVIEDDDRLPF